MYLHRPSTGTFVVVVLAKNSAIEVLAGARLQHHRRYRVLVCGRWVAEGFATSPCCEGRRGLQRHLCCSGNKARVANVMVQLSVARRSDVSRSRNLTNREAANFLFALADRHIARAGEKSQPPFHGSETHKLYR